ncbi:Heterocyst differentiation ATP-binding protein HepA [Cognatishimia activa]|uniref:Heterocyst differentiation ATP-binding protein HepA n=2 Tax=Cognatishimia activa TaxID=1715691 RepID=A0A0P1IVN2_9RHOB|nr:ABC transporter ATP-binding protein [Cognatishimia activa]CUK27620.1 Heterocyst differentiation ATP-binding protein HepA [Cognatishimia activa]
MSQPNSSIDTFKSGARIVQELAQLNRTRLFLAFGAMIIGGFFDGVSILIVLVILGGAQQVDDGQYNVFHDGGEIFGYALPEISISLNLALVMFLGLLAFTIVIMRFRATQLNLLLFGFANTQRLALFSALSQASWQDIQSRRDSDIEHALTGEIDRITGCAYSVLNFIQAAIFASIYILFGLAISWQMMVSLILVSALLWLGMTPFLRRSARLGQTLQENRGQQYQLISTFLARLKQARVSNTEQQHLSEFREAADNHTSVSQSFARLTATAHGMFQFGIAVAVILFLIVSLQILQRPIPEVVVLLVVALRVALRVQVLQGSAQSFLAERPAWRHIQDLTKRFEKSVAAAPTVKEPVPEIGNCLELKDVSFSYEENETSAISDVTLKIEKDKITALIGPSGSGKSTLVDLMLGLLEPKNGEIRLDGLQMQPEMFASWRDQIAYVGQEATLINGTIRDNLCAYVSEPPDEDAIADALWLANAEDFVMDLNLGLDEPVGERGALLSGGQRQRVAIAAAMLSFRPVLILDEATSALDWESQQVILNGLSHLTNAGTTILLVAHRPSVVLSADNVYVLDNGRIRESGALSDIMEDKDGYLARMIQSEVKS